MLRGSNTLSSCKQMIHGSEDARIKLCATERALTIAYRALAVLSTRRRLLAVANHDNAPTRTVGGARIRQGAYGICPSGQIRDPCVIAFSHTIITAERARRFD